MWSNHWSIWRFLHYHQHKGTKLVNFLLWMFHSIICLVMYWSWQSSSAAHIYFILFTRVGGTTGSTADQQSTNDRKVVGSRPTKVVCITVLTGNRMGWTARCGRPPLLLPSCRKLEFRLSVLMDSDLAWVNGKSGRQSWRYADAFSAL